MQIDKMKQNKILLWVAGIAAVVGGVFIAAKAFNRKQDEKKQDAVGNQPVQADQQTPALVEKQEQSKDGIKSLLDAATQGIVKGVKNITSRYMKYRVITQETALNVRQKPDGNSKVVAKLQKDSFISARSSNVVGWMQVSKDGKTALGFVSSSFLRYEG